MSDDLKASANFLFEVGILNQAPRSGFQYMGGHDQSVSEHVHRVMHIGFVLASLEPKADMSKVLKMCLFHDITEARTSDLGWVHQQYVKADEGKALKDMTESLPFGKEITDVLEEYEERISLESLLAKDADIIELILTLKERKDAGNAKADSWIPTVTKRLKTESGKALSDKILETHSDEWWFGDRNEDWWVHRKSEKRNA